MAEKLWFIRYGGLSSVPQDGYDASMPGNHSPPARRGIYAMVAQAVDLTLVTGNFQPGEESDFDSRRMEWVRNSAGEIENDNYGQPKRRLKKPKRFLYDGELWHHLAVPRHEIIKAKGKWVLTTSDSHRRAFAKAFAACKHEGSLGMHKEVGTFEVFIEKV